MPAGVLAFERWCGEDGRLILVNFNGTATRVPLRGEHVVDITSDSVEGTMPYGGRLGAETAVILRQIERPKAS